MALEAHVLVFPIVWWAEYLPFDVAPRILGMAQNSLGLLRLIYAPGEDFKSWLLIPKSPEGDHASLLIETRGISSNEGLFSLKFVVILCLFSKT